MLDLGSVSGLFGVRGWVKVVSETVPRENILTYKHWHLGEARTPWVVAEGRRHARGLIARLEGCEDRDQAAAIVGQTIAVRRDQLPDPASDEVYFADMEGLTVETIEGTLLGRVDHLFSTAANDVLVVKGDRERLLPFLWDRVIKEVDLDLGRIRVDWDPDF